LLSLIILCGVLFRGFESHNDRFFKNMLHGVNCFFASAVLRARRRTSRLAFSPCLDAS
jgi:hypothetical protein